MKKIDWRSPYFCMTLVVLMYIIKFLLKTSVGLKINSVALYSDGLHNLADMFEAGLLIFAIYLSKQKESERYPLGKSSIESLGSFLIGLVILVLGITFFLKSLLGLLIYFNALPALAGLLQYFISPPERIDVGSNAFLAIAAVIFSLLLAWIFSWYEITTGRKRNHPSLVSDGKETLADSFVELAVLVGIIGSLFGLFYLDYIFGIVVSIVMLNTSREVLSESFGNLLQRSINIEDFEKIRRILKQSKGIESFETEDTDRLMAFKLGKFIFVSSKIYISPMLTPEGIYHLRKGASQRIKSLFPDSEVRVYLKTSVIKEKPSRAIIPVNPVSGEKLDAFIEEDFLKAKSFFIADLKGSRIITVKEYKNEFKDIKELKSFMKNKKIDTIYSVNLNKKLAENFKNMNIEKTSFITFRDMFH